MILAAKIIAAWFILNGILACGWTLWCYRASATNERRARIRAGHS